MISTTLSLLFILTAHPVLPDDNITRMHPLLNTDGRYAVATVDRQFFLVKLSDVPGQAPLPVEPFRLHRAAVVLLALLFSLYLFAPGKIFRVLATWLIALPTAAFLFHAATTPLSPAAFHTIAIMLTAFAGAIGMNIILGGGQKGMAASLGVAIAVPATYVLLLIFIRLTKMTGFSAEAIMILDYIIRHLNAPTPLPDYSRILLLSMLFGALGSLCDMSADVTSGSYEMMKKSTQIPFKSLIRLSDHAIGSMTNTLILAYFGGNLMLVFSWMALPEPPPIFWNREGVAIEFLRAIGGSFGFLVTAIFCGLIVRRLHNSYIFNQLKLSTKSTKKT